MATTAVPQRIRRLPEGLEIDWDGAGHVALYPARTLRQQCPCAQCIDEMSGRPILDPASVPLDVTPMRVDLVGSYAIKVSWSDGHSTGIFPFPMLLSRCPCPRCHPG